METLPLKVIKLLKKECSCANGVTIFMKHIIVNTGSPDAKKMEELVGEIIPMVKQYFPEREERLVFVITGEGLKDVEFSIERKIMVKE